MGVQLSKNKGGYLYLKSPKEQLMKMLVEKTLAVGHMLSFREACEDPDMVDPNNYAFYFGSFGEAAKIAWNKATNPQRDKDVADSTKNISIPNSQKSSYSRASSPKPHNYTNPNIYKGPKLEERKESYDVEPYLDDDYSKQAENGHSRKKRVGQPRSRTSKYTTESVKQQLVRFYKENGRLPKQIEVASDPNLPCWTTLYKILGDREEWYRLVEAELKKEHSPQPQNAESLLHDDFASSEGQVVVSEAPDNNPNAVGAAIKPVINAKYHWEGSILQVEVRVVKPGNARPVYVTLSV